MKKDIEKRAHKPLKKRVAPANDPAPQPVAAMPAQYAPLWDLPHLGQPIQIPIHKLTATLLHRWVSDNKGGFRAAYLETLPPSATQEYIKGKWGGGDFWLQARVGNQLKYEQTITIEGPPKGADRGPFPPIVETASGLMTAVDHDPISAFVWAQSQAETARVREDSNHLIALIADLHKTQTEQMSSTKMVFFLEAQIKVKDARISELENVNRDLLKQAHEAELKNARKELPKSMTEQFIEAAIETAPELLEKFPLIAKAIDKGLARAAGLDTGESERKRIPTTLVTVKPSAQPAQPAQPTEQPAQPTQEQPK